MNRLEQDLPLGVPSFLRDFYLTASADAECRFSWSPNSDQVSVSAYVDGYSIYGGPNLCAANSLKDHQNNLMSWADVLDEYAGHGANAAAMLRRCVPLIAVGNGDYVAIERQGKQDGPVFYISHETNVEDESPIIPYCNSGKQFMTVWERFGYLGPEIWVLFQFLNDSTTGMLDPDSSLANQWRAFLGSFGVTVPG
jgi:hypothetical protein